MNVLLFQILSGSSSSPPRHFRNERREAICDNLRTQRVQVIRGHICFKNSEYPYGFLRTQQPSTNSCGVSPAAYIVIDLFVNHTQTGAKNDECSEKSALSVFDRRRHKIFSGVQRRILKPQRKKRMLGSYSGKDQDVTGH